MGIQTVRPTGAISEAPGGTPGTYQATPVTVPVIRINELMADNQTAVPHGTNFPDWIELFNGSAQTVDLANWSLSDDSNLRKFVFPAETSLSSGEFLVVWCDDQTNAPGWHAGFALDRTGETVFLFDATTNRVDALGFGFQLPDYSLGRVGENGQTWSLTLPTPGTANQAAALASPTNLVINEWQANPFAGGSDWVEIYNRDPDAPAALLGLYLGNGIVSKQLHDLSFIAAAGHSVLNCDEQPGIGPP